MGIALRTSLSLLAAMAAAIASTASASGAPPDRFCTKKYCSAGGAIRVAASAPPAGVTPGTVFPITVSGQVISRPFNRRCQGHRRVDLTLFSFTSPRDSFESAKRRVKTDGRGNFSVTIQYTALAAESEKWDSGFPIYLVGAFATLERRRFKGKRLNCGNHSHLDPGGSGTPIQHPYASGG